MPRGVPVTPGALQKRPVDTLYELEKLVPLCNHQPTLVLFGHSAISKNSAPVRVPPGRVVIFYADPGSAFSFADAKFVLEALDKNAEFPVSIPESETNARFTLNTATSHSFTVTFPCEQIGEYLLGMYALDPNASDGEKLEWVQGQDGTPKSLSDAFELAEKLKIKQVLALCCQTGCVEKPKVPEVAPAKVANSSTCGIGPPISSGSDSQKRNAAEALGSLAFNSDNWAAIAKSGDIGPLIELIRSGNDSQKTQAAGALRMLSFDDDNKVAIAKAGGIGPLIELIRSGNDFLKGEAGWTLCMLALNHDNRAAIGKAGGIGPLIELIRSANDSQKVCAARALSTIALDNENRVAIAEAGGIEPLMVLASSHNDTVKNAATQALKNLNG